MSNWNASLNSADRTDKWADPLRVSSLRHTWESEPGTQTRTPATQTQSDYSRSPRIILFRPGHKNSPSHKQFHGKWLTRIPAGKCKSTLQALLTTVRRWGCEALSYLAKKSQGKTKNPAPMTAYVIILRRFCTCLITFDRNELWSWKMVKLKSAINRIGWQKAQSRLRPEVGAQSKTTNVWPLALDFLSFCSLRPNALQHP